MNDWLARVVTRAVGSMWAAYLFGLLALVSLPAALRSHDPVTIVGWISQTFLQLVLLSIIMVGQGLLDEAGEDRSIQTHDAVMEELALVRAMIAEHHNATTHQ